MRNIRLASMLFIFVYSHILTAQTFISCDGDHLGALSTIGEMDEYIVNIPDDSVRLIVQLHGKVWGFEPSLELLTPDGTLLASHSVSHGITARIGSILLPSAGDYKIRVRENGNDFAGEYGLSVQLLRTSCAQTLINGTLHQDTLSLPAQMKMYAIPVQAGRRVIFHFSDYPNIEVNQLEFFHADGSPWFENLSDLLSPRLVRLDTMIGQNDTLLVLVRDDNGTSFLPNAFGVFVSVLDPGLLPDQTCTADTSGEFIHPAQFFSTSFKVDFPGQKILLRAQDNGISIDGILTLYAPDGTLFQILDETEQFAILQHEVIFNLPGTWFATYRNETGSNLGKFGVSFQSLNSACFDEDPGDCAADASEMHHIKHRTQIQAFRIRNVTGRVMVRAVAENESLRIRLDWRHADGSPFLIADAKPGIKYIDLEGTPGDNSYVLVSSHEKDRVGRYRLAFVELAEPTCATTIVCEDSPTAYMDRPGALKQFHIFAKAGQTLIAQGRDQVNSTLLTLELFNSSGDSVAGSNPAPIGRLVHNCATTGDYFLLLKTLHGYDSATFRLNLHVANDFECGSSIAWNDSREELLDFKGDQKGFVFSGKQGDKMAAYALSCPPPNVTGPVPIEIWDEAGTLVANASGLNAGEISIINGLVLPSDGKYKMIVRSHPYNPAGEFGMSIQKFNPGENAQTLIPGVEITGDLQFSGASQAFVFTATQGNEINLKLEAISTFWAVRLELHSPSGISLGMSGSGSSNASINHSNLPETGMYTVIVRHTFNECRAAKFKLNLSGTVPAPDIISINSSMHIVAQPIPSLSGFDVTIPDTELSIRLILTDAVGRICRNIPADSGKVWLERGELPAGIYLLYAIDPNMRRLGFSKIVFVN